MPDYQVTSWRDLPSMVACRDGDQITKAQLAARFQEAIDEAAMRLGEVDATAYLEGWVRTDWIAADGSPAEVLDRVVSGLESQWDEARLQAYLDQLGVGQDS